VLSDCHRGSWISAREDLALDMTVVICTHNRCQALPMLLDGIAKSVLPELTTWEVLVVDNNSSDRTAETVEEFSRRYPARFRYLLEPQPGKSYALNAAIRESRGKILAFVDDDATVEPSWLQRLTGPMGDSIWSGVGGPVILQWSCPRPRWLPRERWALAPIAGFNPDRKAGEITEPIFFGTNMAFRRTMFEKYGNFRTDLGPSPNPNTPRPNEDSEFVQRVLAAGEHLFYEPTAAVFHPVPVSRLQKKYFRSWWFDKGRADTRVFGISPRAKWFVGRVPLYLLRKLTIWTIRWMAALDPSKRFSSRLSVQWLVGAIVECRHQSRSHASRSEIQVAHPPSSPNSQQAGLAAQGEKS
jgi:glucosyl-dolichyl phosphate glucuronosyltransferase